MDRILMTSLTTSRRAEGCRDDHYSSGSRGVHGEMNSERLYCHAGTLPNLFVA